MFIVIHMMHDAGPHLHTCSTKVESVDFINRCMGNDNFELLWVIEGRVKEVKTEFMVKDII